MTTDQMITVVAECDYPGYSFKLWEDSRGAIYLQAAYEEPDTVTGVNSLQQTRRWFLSPGMTKSEIVSTVFKCVLTSMEHKTREWFKYRDKSIYGPHFNVDDLHRICERIDSRQP